MSNPGCLIIWRTGDRVKPFCVHKVNSVLHGTIRCHCLANIASLQDFNEVKTHVLTSVLAHCVVRSCCVQYAIRVDGPTHFSICLELFQATLELFLLKTSLNRLIVVLLYFAIVQDFL